MKDGICGCNLSQKMNFPIYILVVLTALLCVNIVFGFVYCIKFIIVLDQGTPLCTPFREWMVAYIVTWLVWTINIGLTGSNPGFLTSLLKVWAAFFIPYGIYLGWMNEDCDVFQEFIHIAPMVLIFEHYIYSAILIVYS